MTGDARWYVVANPKRFASGCLRNVCNSAFYLGHVVRIGYAGNAVLIIGDVALWHAATANPTLRAVALTNAVLMLLGQFWYTAFWGSDAAIAAFVRIDPRTASRQHVLHGCRPCPNLLLCCSVAYYATFSVLFAASARLEPPGGLWGAYATAASAWHTWLAILVGLSALLRWPCGLDVHTTRFASVYNDESSAPGTAPSLAEDRAFPVSTQLALPSLAPQRMHTVAGSGGGPASGLFKFERIATNMPTHPNAPTSSYV